MILCAFDSRFWDVDTKVTIGNHCLPSISFFSHFFLFSLCNSPGSTQAEGCTKLSAMFLCHPHVLNFYLVFLADFSLIEKNSWHITVWRIFRDHKYKPLILKWRELRLQDVKLFVQGQKKDSWHKAGARDQVLDHVNCLSLHNMFHSFKRSY